MGGFQEFGYWHSFRHIPGLCLGRMVFTAVSWLSKRCGAASATGIERAHLAHDPMMPCGDSRRIVR